MTSADELSRRAEFYWDLAMKAEDDRQFELYQDLALMFEDIVRSFARPYRAAAVQPPYGALAFAMSFFLGVRTRKPSTVDRHQGPST